VVDHSSYDTEDDEPSSEGHMTRETSERIDLGIYKGTLNVESTS
jgi:hypothetical protein